MASLLDRANQVRENLKEKAEIDAIPMEERKEIFKEIDEAVSSRKLIIKENTFIFNPVKKDYSLLIIINGGAFILILLVSFLFYYFLNQEEISIVSKSETITSAQSALIETLKQESEKLINAKEEEVLNIQIRLDEMKRQQNISQLNSQKEISRIEEELRLSYAQKIASERRKLLSEGISPEEINDRLEALEQNNLLDFEVRFTLLKSEYEEQQLVKDNKLNELISSYESDLQKNEDEKRFIEQSDEQTLAHNQLASLNELKEREEFVIGQVYSLYKSVNESLIDSNFESANKNLTVLEEFINKETVSPIPAISFRREVDQFLIRSLRKLVNVAVDDDETPSVLLEISEMLNQGNQFYNQGNLKSARESYLNLIAYIPAVDQGFSQIKNIDNQELFIERKKFAESLRDAEISFQSKDYRVAILQYQQVLEHLSNDRETISNIVDKLVQTGAGLEKDSFAEQSIISQEDLNFINDAKLREASRTALIEELSSFEKKLILKNEASEQTTDDIISLLNTKLLIKEVLTSNTVKDEYPDLHNKLDMYLDAYGKEKERFGRNMALNEILSIMDTLSDKNQSDPFALLTTNEIEQKELFQLFLSNLKNLIESEG